MASKWSHLKGKVPVFELEPEFQQKVNAQKGAYVALEASELARAFARLKANKKEYEFEIANLNVELEALSQLLVENLETSELAKITTASGATVYMQTEPYVSIEDREKVVAWFTKRKLKSMLTVMWQTLNSMTKERLEAGESAIPGTKVFLKTSARLRNGDSE